MNPCCFEQTRRQVRGNVSVSINSPDGEWELEELRRRITAAHRRAPQSSWSIAEAGAVCFVLEAIARGRELERGTVIAFPSR